MAAAAAIVQIMLAAPNIVDRSECVNTNTTKNKSESNGNWAIRK